MIADVTRAGDVRQLFEYGSKSYEDRAIGLRCGGPSCVMLCTRGVAAEGPGQRHGLGHGNGCATVVHDTGSSGTGTSSTGPAHGGDFP